MDSETKKSLIPLLMLPPAYILLLAGMLYAVTDDAPYIAIACAAISSVIIVYALQSFFSKTVLKGKVSYSPIVPLKPLLSESDEKTRDVRIIVSGYAGKIKLKLHIDGIEIANATAGDRFKIPLTYDSHILAVKDAAGNGSEERIPKDGDYEFYVWCNRKAKSTKDVIQINDVTGGVKMIESEDAASYAAYERVLKYMPITGGISSFLAVAVAFLLM